ncbi:hypothetical protein ABZ468_07165 [Streptomyces sp. NPDC005708]|uniref:hypothetical protein n=1 Tax=Streptomyces sp. NPDC005708 TaxID=3154564 RepID=UPI0033D25A74
MTEFSWGTQRIMTSASTLRLPLRPRFAERFYSSAMSPDIRSRTVRREPPAERL